MSLYELSCRYDKRKSFYGKAQVDASYDEIRLYSYNTLVARITFRGVKTTYEWLGHYSQTTTRHQKEFFKQNGLDDNQIEELKKKGKIEMEDK